ncbi:MAG: hypothetical protein K5750_06380 [Eubacterium sp.]|nr:hypothetical protein [Eubacterium sp.]
MDNRDENRKIGVDRRFYFCAIITVTLLYLILDTMFHMNSLDKEDQTEDYSENWFYAVPDRFRFRNNPLNDRLCRQIL